ncbi:hypothetical protein BDK51DRAFT_32737 [Blyttiomyces helicus]|uniref:Uncharacterized protein n=1 Tax=Blyttiomyces helicus TaxID=388810 RepID=A0A4P9WQE6_9FUNG|nr:hypothetical protein BDK51DRAFT_32737 [Blyttiomyces helicus]|eukprot:RKO93440.1 hypothetical protein BDK51DRAFT_32737 [Blyttiomyces helicus]
MAELCDANADLLKIHAEFQETRSRLSANIAGSQRRCEKPYGSRRVDFKEGLEELSPTSINSCNARNWQEGGKGWIKSGLGWWVPSSGEVEIAHKSFGFVRRRVGSRLEGGRNSVKQEINPYNESTGGYTKLEKLFEFRDLWGMMMVESSGKFSSSGESEGRSSVIDERRVLSSVSKDFGKVLSQPMILINNFGIQTPQFRGLKAAKPPTVD